MQIEIIQSVRDDGAILQSVKIPPALKTENLASEDRKLLAMIFISAAQHLLANVLTANVNEGRDAFEAEAEKLALEFGGDTYQSYRPTVRLASWKMAKLINHVRIEEREACANVCEKESALAVEIGHERFARYSAEMAQKIRMRPNS